MKHIKQGELHIVLAARLDGAICILYTREPIAWLAALGDHCQVGEVEVRATTAAARIANQLRSRFAVASIPDSAFWFQIDFRQALRALNEIDLATGKPLRDLAVNADVMVFPQRTRGNIFGFTPRGNVVVLLRSRPGERHLTLVRRADLKPVLRSPPATPGGAT
jgi:hypothetical protein